MADKQHLNCKEYLKDLCSNEPLIVFIIKAMQKQPNSNQPYPVPIRCAPCPDRVMSGHFDPETGITLCENALTTRTAIKETLAHELVHAYDNQHREMNWKEDIKQHVCSEIRATMLSGECRLLNEIRRGYGFPIRDHFTKCVKRRVLLSMQQRADQSPQDYEKLIDSLLPICMKDTSPFLYIP